MTEAVESRSVSLTDLEVRADGEGRTICGVCVPYDRPTQIGTYTEVFRRGAFSKTIQETQPSRIKLTTLHDDRSMPIGHATELRESDSPAGLYGEFKIAGTPRGDETLQLVKDGTIDALSIEFVPVRSFKAKDGTVERREAKLVAVSVVPRPAYDDARIAQVRAEAVEDVEPDETTRPDERMSLSRARLIAEQVRKTAPEVTPELLR